MKTSTPVPNGYIQLMSLFLVTHGEYRGQWKAAAKFIPTGTEPKGPFDTPYTFQYAHDPEDAAEKAINFMIHNPLGSEPIGGPKIETQADRAAKAFKAFGL